MNERGREKCEEEKREAARVDPSQEDSKKSISFVAAAPLIAASAGAARDAREIAAGETSGDGGGDGCEGDGGGGGSGQREFHPLQKTRGARPLHHSGDERQRRLRLTRGEERLEVALRSQDIIALPPAH